MTRFGYRGAEKRVGNTLPSRQGEHLVYSHEGLDEWYVNSYWGIEQGFTVFQAPQGGDASGILLLEMAITGDVTAKIQHNALVLNTSHGAEMRYSGLQAYDAKGKNLPVQMVLNDSSLQLLVDAKDAVYPLTIDPWLQNAKLTASDGIANDFFGWSVAISGNTMVVGAYGDDDNGSSSGAAYVFVRPDSGWAAMTETAKLTASDSSSSDYFGSSVAISDSTIVVGAYGEDANGEQSGAAYVFVRPTSGWTTMTETAKLTASDESSYDFFGSSVAVSDTTIVVGAYGDDTNGERSGAAYVFVRPDSGWTTMTETVKLTASDGSSYDFLASSVAISDDTIVAGAYGDDTNGERSGAAYVFVCPDSGWSSTTETAKLTASDGSSYDFFGSSVAVSDTTVVVGAYGDDTDGDRSGSAYVFVRPDSGWATMTESAKLTASDGAKTDSLGMSVAIDNDTIVVGAPGDGDAPGAAYIYDCPDSGWTTMTESAKLTASEGEDGDSLGQSVDITEGSIALGAYGADALKSSAGTAYIFSTQSTSEVDTSKKTVPSSIFLLTILGQKR